MMLPDRHIHVDARQLQAILDAEGDRTAFNRLRASVRELERQADLPLALGAMVLPAMVAIAALVAAVARGMV